VCVCVCIFVCDMFTYVMDDISCRSYVVCVCVRVCMYVLHSHAIWITYHSYHM